jgi:hypothetical protein
MKSICILIVLCFLSSCANFPKEYKEPAEFYVSENILYYKGRITDFMVLKALELANKNEQKITALHIDSGGGDARSGIVFGNWVHDNGITVVIENKCFSSCANYILTAAPKVHVLKGAIVGWHGGAFQETWIIGMRWYEYLIPNRKASKEAYYSSGREPWKEEETTFFEKVGVDQRITTYGQISKLNCQNSTGASGWNYSLIDLKKLGVANLIIDDGELALRTDDIKTTACRVTLGDI